MKSFVINIDRADLEASRERIKAEYGVTIEGDHGKTAGLGCVLDYDYAEPHLTIAVESKPDMLPEFLLERNVRHAFQPGAGHIGG